MRPSSSFGKFVVLSSLLTAGGCGRDPFVPPARSRPTVRESVQPSKPVFLVLVTPTVPEGDLEVWAARAQHEANDKRAIFRVMKPGLGESQASQPGVVVRAIAEGASALIVYPGDSPDLAKSLAHAEDQGVPVVLLDKGLAAPEGRRPFTVVEVAPFEESARQIVSATVEDLKQASQPVDGRALVLVDKVVDQTSGLRVEALASAAKAAGFREVVRVPFDSSVETSAEIEVAAAVKTMPDVSIVLTDDAEGMTGASVARKRFGGKPIFFVGGYTDYRTSRIIITPGRESCYVEGRYTELAALAVNTALDKLKGSSVPDRCLVTSKFIKTLGAVATEEDRLNSQSFLSPAGHGEATSPKDAATKKESPEKPH